MSGGGQPYRLHAAGPWHDIRQDRPGKVYVIMRFPEPLLEVPGHIHAFDHVMRVAAGIVRVTVDGASTIYRAGAEVMVPAGVRHAVQALAPDTVVECEHDVRAANGEIDPEAFSPDGIPLEWITRLTIGEEGARA